MGKLSEIFTAVIATIAGLFAAFLFARKKAGQSAEKHIAIADEHEEMADLREVEAAEELAVAAEENKAAQEIADSIDPMKDDKTPVNHTRKRFDFS